MKRQVGFLIEKRDGRREWLRATKLARSIRLALQAAESGDDWIATDLAAAVVAGLRARGDEGPVRADVIADAVVRVLLATNYPRAAAQYMAVRGERDRRRQTLLEADGSIGERAAFVSVAGLRGLGGDSLRGLLS